MMRKTLAFILALSLMLGAALALAEGAATEVPAVSSGDTVLATLNGEPITLNQVEDVMPTLANYMNDSTDYRYAVNFIIQQRILDKKIKELGFDQFSAEENAAFTGEAQQQWEQGINSYVSYFLSEDTEDARAKMKTQAEEFYAQQGFSVDVLAENLRKRASVDRLSNYLVGDYQPTEEEINSAFQLYGAQYQDAYQNDIMAYEYNTIFNHQPSWYTPEGYRGIIHILLTPDQEKLDEYNRLQSAYEEQQSALEGESVDKPAQEEATEAPAADATPAPTSEPVTQEMLAQAKQAVLDSRKAELDQIMDRLNKGESFAALVKEYGQDPGMMDEQQLQKGYNVHQNSIAWDPVFTAAAFSDKMQKVGDHSDPVIGSHGIHVLHYLRDVPSGLIITDEIKAELVEFLRTMKEGTAFNTAYEQWLKENQVELKDEAIQAAIDAAKPVDQETEQPETEGLMAVPEAEPTAAPAP